MLEKNASTRARAPAPARETSGAGAAIEAKLDWYGDPATARAVIGLLPALGVGTRYYARLGEEFARRGYALATIGIRAQPLSVLQTRRRNYGYYEILELDLPPVVERLRSLAAGRPLFLCGHSLGGQFALLHASRRPDGVTGVVLIAGGSNHYAALPNGHRLVQRKYGIRMVRLIVRALGFFPGDRLGFGGRQPKNLMLDWSEEALHARYRSVRDPRDPNKDLEALRCPVLFVAIESDTLVPKQSAELLARKLKAAHTCVQELAASAFSRSVDHFRWAREPAPVVAAIERWIGEVTSQVG